MPKRPRDPEPGAGARPPSSPSQPPRSASQEQRKGFDQGKGKGKGKGDGKGKGKGKGPRRRENRTSVSEIRRSASAAPAFKVVLDDPHNFRWPTLGQQASLDGRGAAIPRRHFLSFIAVLYAKHNEAWSDDGTGVMMAQASRAVLARLEEEFLAPA